MVCPLVTAAPLYFKVPCVGRPVTCTVWALSSGSAMVRLPRGPPITGMVPPTSATWFRPRSARWMPLALGVWLLGVMSTVTTWLVRMPPAPSSTVMVKLSVVVASTCEPLCL